MCNWCWKGHASDGDSIWIITYCYLSLDDSLAFSLPKIKRCTERKKRRGSEEILNAGQQHCVCSEEEEKNPIPNSLNCSKTVARFSTNRQHTNHTTLLVFLRGKVTTNKTTIVTVVVVDIASAAVDAVCPPLHHSTLVYRILARRSPAFSVHTAQ